MNLLTSLKQIKVDPNDIKQLRDIESEVNKIINNNKVTAEEFIKILDSEESLNVRFFSLFGLVTHYRNVKESEELNIMFEKYKEPFYEFITFKHLSFLVEFDWLKFNSFNEDLCITLLNDVEAFIQEVAKKHKLDNAKFFVGTLHLYTDLFISIIEAKDKMKDKISDKYDTALNYLEKAINIEQYPKFFCTKARLYSYKQAYREAFININKAISKEDASKEHYETKIVEYTFVKNLIILKKTQSEVMIKLNEYEVMMNEQNEKYLQQNNKLEQQKEELEQQKLLLIQKTEEVDNKLSDTIVRNVEIIGFFTGIISFVIASVQMAMQLSFLESAALIIVLLGAWIISYCCFSILFKKNVKEEMKKYIIVFSVGTIFAIIGAVIGIYFC